MIRRCKLRVGSRAQVMHGIAKMTAGGLTKIKLKYNKQGKIVSRKASNTAKKANKLVKAGYITRKGHFGVVKRGGLSEKRIEFRDMITKEQLINYGYPNEFVITTNNNKKIWDELTSSFFLKNIDEINEILLSENYKNFMYNIESFKINSRNNTLLKISYYTISKLNEKFLLNKNKHTILHLMMGRTPAPVGNFMCYLKCLLMFSYMKTTIATEIINNIIRVFITHFKYENNEQIKELKENNVLLLRKFIINIINGHIIIGNTINDNFAKKIFYGEIADIPTIIHLHLFQTKQQNFNALFQKKTRERQEKRERREKHNKKQSTDSFANV